MHSPLILLFFFFFFGIHSLSPWCHVKHNEIISDLHARQQSLTVCTGFIFFPPFIRGKRKPKLNKLRERSRTQSLFASKTPDLGKHNECCFLSPAVNLRRWEAAAGGCLPWPGLPLTQMLYELAAVETYLGTVPAGKSFCFQ